MDVDSDSDAASSASIRSETMGLPLADAIEPFPDVLSPDVFTNLPAVDQERALERVADVNIRMARLMTEFLQLVNPKTSETMARVDLHDPTGCVELARLLETRPALALEEQYEDFGIWRAVQRASVSVFTHADQLLKDLDPSAEAAAVLQRDASSENLTLADVMRNSVANHCQEELELVRQEPHMNKSKLSSLLAALETGADLLKPTEEFWLRKKAPAKST